MSAFSLRWVQRVLGTTRSPRGLALQISTALSHVVPSQPSNRNFRPTVTQNRQDASSAGAGVCLLETLRRARRHDRVKRYEKHAGK
ncbi:MAG: hypothetical protein KDA61_15710 [Planctomycetales bacterium]|nr:hypothetical protein [Planctomycetales bacterium]